MYSFVILYDLTFRRHGRRRGALPGRQKVSLGFVIRNWLAVGH